MKAEQWLVVTENLLGTARVADGDRAEVIKIQFMNIARTWWLAMENQLEKPIIWETFKENFYMSFFP